MNNRLINTKVAGGGGCTDIVDNYDPFGGNGVALYQLNGDANDVSGNYNGTASNVTYGTGVFGQAGVFNGSSSIIDVSNLPLRSNFDSTGELTISYWINTTFNHVGRILEFSKNFGVSHFTRDYNKIQFNLSQSNSTSVQFENSTTLVDDTWYNIIVTYDSSNIKVYINGSLDVTQSYNGTINNFTDPLYQFLTIGAAKRTDNPSFFHYVGSLDQFRIFNTALDPLEVEALYTEELCICDGTVDTLDILGDGSCIATYQLDGNANDLSGNYSGTESGTISYGVGDFDLAAVYDGSGSYINLQPTLGCFFAQKQTVSVSIWWKWDGTTDNNIFSDYANSSFNISLNVNKGGVGKISLVTRYNYSTTTTTSSTSTFNDGNWHHAVAVINQSNLTHQLYVDNVLEGSNSIPSASYNGSGQGLGIGGQAFAGSIDQVRIFNKALNSTEVTTLYNETACTKATCSGTTNTLDILGDGSCIAAYPLDGSPADLSGNYNGVQTNVIYPVGEFDLAGSFNGTSSRIEVPFASKPSLSTCTVSFWLKTTSTTPQALVGEGYSSGFWGNFQSYISSNKLNVRTGNASTAEDLFWESTSDVNTGSWVHCLVTMEGNTSKIYINGNLETTKTLTVTRAATSEPFTIGQFYANGTLFSSWTNDCLIDQVRVFNKALSAGEVTTLYNETPCN